MLHNAFLVHDDIEDGSDFRRGTPTMHRRAGVAVALNAGDAMNALAMRLYELQKFSTSLRDPENVIIGTLEGGCGHWVQAPSTDLPTFSVLDGAALRTLIQVATPFQVGGGENFVLRIGPSKHPIADKLRTLGLGLASSLSVQYADPFQALLFPGRSLGTGR